MTVPPSKPTDSLSFDLQQHIDQQCLAFEDSLLNEQSPSIEEYIAEESGPPRSALLYELLLVELDHHQRSGRSSSLNDYLLRFPDEANIVQGAFADLTPVEAEALPKCIDRFEVVRKIGSGSFGVVYEGHDPDLHRSVAIKVRRRTSGYRQGDDAELEEARTIARLSHPNIVPVFDVGSTDKYPCYIVSALIDGNDVAEQLRQRKFSVDEAVELVAAIADALDYAHEQGVVHCDVKPRNILLDESGRPFLVDFGLARRDEQVIKDGQIAGTPAYMSPEQARGEGHRVTGRSDLFSLGVVLYELLTGRRPFDAESVDRLLAQVDQADPPPLSLTVAGLPEEFQRVCNRAMARRADDRYANGREFAEDLRAALTADEDSARTGIPRGVIPRGLRSFESEDADFFVNLLPGPRDRRGLPRIIKQILTRVESRMWESAFSTGVVFGPSGCGKSSLIKAGVLPRAAGHVHAVYLEATAAQTAPELVRLIKQRFSAAAPETRLRDVLSRVRRGEIVETDHKLLLVIDQFEQWLHVNPDPDSTELAAALRQCDGVRVQCILIVRDDFWFAVNRFMRSIEIPILEGTNSFPVDLFDPEHARRILTSFGQAFSRVDFPATDTQAEFVEQATAELLDGEDISPVRLALFAEMMKQREWSVAALRELGGAVGVSLRFFEETLEARGGNPGARRQSTAVRNVLRRLLPEDDTNIKGAACSRSDLAAVCDGGSELLDNVIRTLDRDLRLITPIEASGEDGTDGEPMWQLAHDYLVPSLRRWLHRYQKQTVTGRAEARLAERTALWSVRRKSRQLPPWWEYLNIRWFTNRSRWTDLQSQMMASAGRQLLVRWTLVAACLVLVAWGVRAMFRSEGNRRAETVVASFQNASASGIPFAKLLLEQEADTATEVINRRLAKKNSYQHEYRLVLAKSLLGKPDIPFLTKSVRYVGADECPNLAMAFARSPRQARAALMTEFEEERDVRTRALFAIQLLGVDEPEPSVQMLQNRADPITRTVWIHEFKTRHPALDSLIRTLIEVTDPAALSGMCIALGAAVNPSPSERDAIEPWLVRMYSTQKNAGVHSAAEFALRRHGFDLPPADLPGADWEIGAQGQTLVRILPGTFRRPLPRTGPATGSQQVLMNRPFWIAATEVSVRQFLEFVNDPDYPKSKKPRPFADGAGKPWDYHHDITRDVTGAVQQVNWTDAVLFCNWLSHRENRQPCYAVSETGGWILDEDANGYRLPTADEWAYANRAGTETFWFPGQDEVLLRDYAWYALTTDYGVRPVGTSFPNPWGLFDTHGNVREWCHDWFRSASSDAAEVTTGQGPATPNGRREKCCRGGSFTHRAEGMRSDRCAAAPMGSRASRIGFRIARNADQTR